VIQIPGFYDDVAVPAPEEKASWERLPFSEEAFLREVGATTLTGDPAYGVLDRVWARPTLEVHGIAGGFTGAGSKTVIPAEATAKVSFRLVPKQDPQKCIEAFRAFLEVHTPQGIRIELRVLGASAAIQVNPQHPAIQVAARAFSDMLRKETVFIRNGGSIPVVGDFARTLGIPSVLMGFGLPDDGLHSPNERFRLENYYTGIMTIAHFLEEYGK
jgi:acetylornithine deacetylase/succinyl-diaminopimelate desuccinylase-like protein